jgi:hypothetical protein
MIIIPILEKYFEYYPRLSIADIVSVQPLSVPSNVVFYLKYSLEKDKEDESNL